MDSSEKRAVCMRTTYMHVDTAGVLCALLASRTDGDRLLNLGLGLLAPVQNCVSAYKRFV
jgi:hypothetical protein